MHLLLYVFYFTTGGNLICMHHLNRSDTIDGLCNQSRLGINLFLSDELPGTQ
jgi:hypothetical protein